MSTDPALITLLIAGLAVARISSLIVHDDILEPVRHRIFQWSPPPEEPGEEVYTFLQVPIDPDDAANTMITVLREPGWIGKMLSCTHCVAVWIAAATYAGLEFATTYTIPVLLVAAFAQISELTIKAAR